MAEGTVAPQKLTPFQRVLFELQLWLETAEWDQHVHSSEFRRGYAKELRRMRTRVDLLFLATFLFALLILAGGLQSGAMIELGPVTLPASFLSQQAVAAITSALYLYYVNERLSLDLMNSAHWYIADTVRVRVSEFWYADVDGERLSDTIFRRKTGFVSPWQEQLYGRALYWLMSAAILFHTAIVVLAEYAAFTSARKVHGLPGWIAIILSALAILVTITALAVFLLVNYVRLDYKWDEHSLPPRRAPK